MGRIGAWVGVSIASLLLHVVALLTPHAPPNQIEETASSAVSVSFTIVEPKTTTAAPPSSEAPPRARVAAERSRQDAVKHEQRTSRQDHRSRPIAPRVEREMTLDTKSAALALVVAQQPMPDVRSGPHGEGSQSHSPFRGVGAKGYLSVREPPGLRRHRDGTYRYRGNTFRAVVEQDGSVIFDDGYRQGTTVAFDITDHMMRKRGEDPYRVEKQWFLDSTEEFRHTLFERWRAKHARIALQKLRTRLLRISEDHTLSHHQKEARVVAIYRDTADDEAGAAAREAIATFVVRQMPGVSLPEVAK